MSLNAKSNTPAKKTTSSSNSQPSNIITLEDVMRKLISIDDTLKSYANKFNIINNSLSAMQTSINNLREENIVLKDDISNLRSKIIMLETNFNPDNKLSSDEVITEIQNRMDKSNNVIIFNLSEKPSENANNTLSIVRDMLSDLDLNLNIVQARRIGKTHSVGRPLVIEFGTASNAKTLLKHKSKLRSIEKWKNVWINADLTRTQQTYMKTLRDTLRQKRLDGDSNSIIKYFNGVPKICTKN